MVSTGPADSTTDGTASHMGTGGGTEALSDRADSHHGRDVTDGAVLVLFVCTANRVRSPFAAAVARRRVAEMGLPLVVGSAGLLGSDHDPAFEQIERQARRYGTDLSEHRSTALTVDMLEASDLVVTMTGRQIIGLVNLSPTAQRKAVTLREWAARSTAGDPITTWTRPAVSQWLTDAVNRPVDTLFSGTVDVVDPTTRWPHRFGRTAAEIDRLVGICLDPLSDHPSIDRPAEMSNDDPPVWYRSPERR